MSIVLTPIGSPSAADITSEANIGIVIPPFSRMYDDKLSQRIRCARLRQGVAATVQLSLLDSAGKVINLNDYGFTSGSSSSSESSSSETPAAGSLGVRIHEASETACKVFTANATVHTAHDGVVRIAIPEEVYTAPAVYWCEIGILNADGNPLYVYPCYLYVERSGWATNAKWKGPPLIDSLRLSIRDSDMYENLLIDNQDFDMAEVAAAAVRVVKYWNETPPPVGVAIYSTNSFPFEDMWIEGIQLFMFQMAEEWYRRNKLPYQAGGIQVDDKNRDKDYKLAWQERFQTFRQRLINKKVSINVQQGFRTIRQL